MTTRLLRRFSLRRRMMLLLVVVALTIGSAVPLLVLSQRRLVQHLQATVQVQGEVNRLLLRTSARLASSRINLLRYVDETVTTPDEALADIDQVLVYLDDARELVDRERGAQIREFRLRVTQYQSSIGELQGARLAGDEERIERLENQTVAWGTRLAGSLEPLMEQSRQMMEEANAAVPAATTRRTMATTGLYAALMVGMLLAVGLVGRTILVPVAELRRGASRIHQGDTDVTVPAESGDELGYLGYVLNEMVGRLDQTQQELSTRVAEGTRELRRRSDYLQAVVDVSRTTTEILDVDRLLDEAVEVIARRFGLYYVGLFLVDEGENAIVLRAGSGEAGQAMVARGHRLQMGQGMIGWTVANAQARISLEAEGEHIGFEKLDLPDTRSEAALPLRVKGEVIGALTVQDDQPGAFDAETMELLQIMADLLAVAIGNARRYSEVQSALASAEEAYGQLTREGLARLLQQETRGYQITPHGQLAPVLGPWQPDLAAARDAGTAIQSDDGRSLAIPISARGQTIGALRLQKGRKSAGWSSREMNLVQTVVEQLAIALDSARLYEDTQLTASRERVAREITDRMRATLNWEELMQSAVAEIGQAVQASRVFVQWIPPQTRRTDPVLAKDNGGAPSVVDEEGIR